MTTALASWPAAARGNMASAGHAAASAAVDSFTSTFTDSGASARSITSPGSAKRTKSSTCCCSSAVEKDKDLAMHVVPLATFLSLFTFSKHIIGAPGTKYDHMPGSLSYIRSFTTVGSKLEALSLFS